VTFNEIYQKFSKDITIECNYSDSVFMHCHYGLFIQISDQAFGEIGRKVYWRFDYVRGLRGYYAAS
jgi:hypothetical protein